MPINPRTSQPETVSDTDDPVDLASEASFPASDPPAWASGRLLEEQEDRLSENEGESDRDGAAKRTRKRESSA
jgi:hypothetical protein